MFIFLKLNNMTDLSKVIIEYVLNNINPKIEDIREIADKYAKIKQVLWDQLFQSWSYPRNTAIRPINDLDIINELPQWKTYQDAEQILRELFDILNTVEARKIIWYYGKPKLQKSSIWLYFSENEDDFSIDIVPAIITSMQDRYSEYIYEVPEIFYMTRTQRKKHYETLEKSLTWNEDWIFSTPKWYIAHAKALDDLSNENFRGLTRFLKAWKRSCKQKRPDVFCVKSFHIEQICWKIIASNSTSQLSDLLELFFDDICNKFNQWAQFEDLAYEYMEEKRYIDQYVEDPEKNTAEFKKILLQEVKRVNVLIRKLTVIDDEESIIWVLDDILNGQWRTDTVAPAVIWTATLIHTGSWWC